MERRRWSYVTVGAACLLLSAWGASGAARSAAVSARAAQASARPTPNADYADVLRRYCVTCHNERAKVAGLVLDVSDLAHSSPSLAVWEKVVRKVKTGMMPPDGVPHPDPAVRRDLVTWLEQTLDRAAVAASRSGGPLARRLNRAEYANAVRDLLAVDVDTTTLLPPDESAYGFDTIADVQGVSPILLERYLAAADVISSRAVGDPEIPLGSETFIVRQDASQDRHVEGLPIGTVGGQAVRTTIPLDGEYLIQVRLYRTNLGAMRGIERRHELEISVDGQRVHVASFGGDEDFIASLANPTAAGDAIDARLSARVALEAGPRTIGVAFLQQPELIPWRLQPFVRSSADTLDVTGWPHVDRFTITGPFNPIGPGETPSREQVFVCRPARPAEEDGCARRILSRLATRAYRGTMTAVDLERLMQFYRAGRTERDFAFGIQVALQRLLTSPKFLFRVERDPDGPAGTAADVSDLELATRLSFFLWSSIPDDELLRLARERQLRRPGVLAQQVRRMVADSRSQALVTDFAGQWLYLRNLKNKQPNSLAFPDFDDNLRRAFQRETESFFESIMREDRSVLDLMTADFTFVNERLAKHYGIPNVYGSHFRRVTHVDDNRRGLLGQGSILMVTSHADRTSPVLRGKWILDNLLGAPPPPPPANVPPLDDQAAATAVRSLRERLEAHRRNPACAGCHKIMDPIGLALENFDAVGAWRTREGGTHGTLIDASGQLLDGTTVNGVASLRAALLREPQLFVTTLAEKLLTYAIGRGLDAADMPVVRQIVRRSAAQNYRFSTLIAGIVTSAPFQMRVKAPAREDRPAAVAANR